MQHDAPERQQGRRHVQVGALHHHTALGGEAVGVHLQATSYKFKPQATRVTSYKLHATSYAGEAVGIHHEFEPPRNAPLPLDHVAVLHPPEPPSS